MELNRQCPFCDRHNDTETGYTDGTTPQVGDILICFLCLNPAVVSEDNTLLEPTDEQWEAICANQDFLNLMTSFDPLFTPQEWKRAAQALKS